MFFVAEVAKLEPEVARTLGVEILLITLILIYGVLLTKIIPRKAHISVNLFATLSIIGLGLLLGLSFKEMGLTLIGPTNFIFITLLVSVAIFLGTFLLSKIPFLKQFFLGESFATAKKRTIIYEAGFRIPFGTALVEETLFRGVLLGLLLQTHTTTQAVLIAAVVFGLWHIAPTTSTLEGNNAVQLALKQSKSRRFGSIAGVVLTTTIAGIFFGWLRVVTGTIITTWLIHWAINSSGAVVAAFTGSKNKTSS
jgi:membrane protease YdiL (CAAX protease family)